MSRIYLVDDHVVLRDGLTAILEAHGHTVIGATGDPTRALADLRVMRPDVTILDLNLGVRSGFELLEEARRRGLTWRCIVLTMSMQPSHMAEAMRLGALTYLLKGATASDLLKAIDAASRGEHYSTPETAELALRALAVRDTPASVSALSAREKQVITLVVQGHSSAKIGDLLHLSPKTVDSYRSRLMAKLGVADVTALVRLAIQMGLIEP